MNLIFNKILWLSILKRNWFGFILLVIGLCIGFYFISSQDLLDYFTNHIDPLLTLLSVVIPFGLWLFYQKSEFEKSLDTVLIVHFTYNEKYIFTCYNSNLLPETDMRALGQQIGMQMSGGPLDFNPSIKPVNSGIEKILDEHGVQKLVKYFEIKFLLLKSPKNENWKHYSVWNMSGNHISKKTFQLSGKSFHESFSAQISLKQLLSSDKNSIETFEAFADVKQDDKKIYIINSPIITNPGIYNFQGIKIDAIKKLISELPFTSAIGHNGTAELLTALLNIRIEHNRIEINQQVGDKLIVFKLKGRMEEGKIYAKEEMGKLEYEFGILERTS